MELLQAYLAMLKTPSEPEHRVVKKTGVLAIFVALSLVYYRHVHLGFGSGESLLVTVALVIGVVGPINIIFGIMNAAFYREFLRATKAQMHEQTFVVFLAEWLFALSTSIACGLLGPVLT